MMQHKRGDSVGLQYIDFTVRSDQQPYYICGGTRHVKVDLGV
jgi:hypothetical protein